MTPALGLQQRILGRLSDEWHTICVLVLPGEDERTIMTTLGTLEQQGLVEGWGSLWRLRDAQPDAPASGLQPDSPTGRAHDGAPHCSPPPVEPDAPRTSGEVDAGADGSVTPEASGSGADDTGWTCGDCDWTGPAEDTRGDDWMCPACGGETIPPERCPRRMCPADAISWLSCTRDDGHPGPCRYPTPTSPEPGSQTPSAPSPASVDVQAEPRVADGQRELDEVRGHIAWAHGRIATLTGEVVRLRELAERRDDLEETEAAVLALLDHAGAPAELTTVGRIGWLWGRLEVRDAG